MCLRGVGDQNLAGFPVVHSVDVMACVQITYEKDEEDETYFGKRDKSPTYLYVVIMSSAGAIIHHISEFSMDENIRHLQSPKLPAYSSERWKRSHAPKLTYIYSYIYGKYW